MRLVEVPELRRDGRPIDHGPLPRALGGLLEPEAADHPFRAHAHALAEEALERLRGDLAPDIVVTDHIMPGLSGTDLARALADEYPDIPVLIVSGYAEEEGIPLNLARLTKPFRRAELSASLASLRP